jgi:hypothetical protein
MDVILFYLLIIFQFATLALYIYSYAILYRTLKKKINTNKHRMISIAPDLPEKDGLDRSESFTPAARLTNSYRRTLR